MTKMNIDPRYEQGLAHKRDIEDLVSGRRQPEKTKRLPSWVSDMFQLFVAAGVGGACAWLGIKFFL